MEMMWHECCGRSVSSGVGQMSAEDIGMNQGRELNRMYLPLPPHGSEGHELVVAGRTPQLPLVGLASGRGYRSKRLALGEEENNTLVRKQQARPEERNASGAARIEGRQTKIWIEFDDAARTGSREIAVRGLQT